MKNMGSLRHVPAKPKLPLYDMIGVSIAWTVGAILALAVPCSQDDPTVHSKEICIGTLRAHPFQMMAVNSLNSITARSVDGSASTLEMQSRISPLPDMPRASSGQKRPLFLRGWFGIFRSAFACGTLSIPFSPWKAY